MKFKLERLCRKPLREIPYEQPEILFSEKLLGFMVDGQFHTEPTIAFALGVKVWKIRKTILTLMQSHKFGSKQIGEFKAWRLLD